MAVTHKQKRLTYKELCLLAQQGNKQAIQELLIRYEKHLEKKAVYWSEKYKDTSLEFEDFKQLVYIGFIESIQKYDIHYSDNNGITLLSYSDYHIKRNIKNAISKYAYNSIIPHNVIDNIKLVLDTMNMVVKQKAIRDKEELYRAVANEINMPVKRVQELYNVYTRNTKTQPLEIYSDTEEQEEIQQAYRKMHGDYTNETEARIAGDNLRKDIAKALGILNSRERKIVILRFGLDGGRARTLEEVAKEFNVTRDRIRQIEAKALRKLRHPSRSKKLEDYLDGNIIIDN